ncbi:head-tail connector protein, partial [Rhodobacter lacus]
EIAQPFCEPSIAREAVSGATIALDVGYAPGAVVPPQLGQAILMLAMEWHEAGITVEESYTAPVLSFGFRRLVTQMRYRRPQVVA